MNPTEMEKYMKSLLVVFLVSALLSSCSKKAEKPPVTIAQYSKQVVQINEVINKLMNEPDIKVMRLMADGVEATRAIGCDAIGEECNAYYEFLNKIVDLTKDNELTPDERVILEKMYKRVQAELEKSDQKIQNDWKNYINAEK